MSAPWRWVARLGIVLAATAVLVLSCTRYVAIPWVVGGVSMEPALADGDRILVDLWSYRGRAPKPGEIALFEGPDGRMLIKRVAAGPVAREPGSFLPPAWDRDDSRVAFIVLGDNRKESLDSRRFGAVPANRFRGRALFRYWPLSRAGLVP